MVPAQNVVADALIETEGGVVGFTVINTLFDVPVEGAAQPKLEVITQVTESLLFKALVANVDELVPALILFTFH